MGAVTVQVSKNRQNWSFSLCPEDKPKHAYLVGTSPATAEAKFEWIMKTELFTWSWRRWSCSLWRVCGGEGTLLKGPCRGSLAECICFTKVESVPWGSLLRCFTILLIFLKCTCIKKKTNKKSYPKLDYTSVHFIFQCPCHIFYFLSFN